MADYPRMKYWQAPDGTVYEVCDEYARQNGGGGSGGGTIDEEAIAEAVNAALEKAKESGEFDGADGEDGKDGVSPTISVSVITSGHRLTIKDANGTKTVDLMDGKDGEDGSDGSDGADGVGIRNIVFKQTTTSGNVYTINLTDNSSYDFTAPVGPKGAEGGGSGGGGGEDGVGIQSIQLKSQDETGNTYTIILTDGSTYDFVAPAGTPGKDGQDGSPGAAGKDGTSVTVASVSESTADGGTNTVTFSDGKKLNIKNGSKGSDGSPGADGKDGTNGKDGVSPTVAVSAITGGNRLTITDANGSRSVDVMNGKNGEDGKDGSDGAPGATGAAGRGVSSMTFNKSTNKWTVVYTDGTSTQIDGQEIPDTSSFMPKSGGSFTGAVNVSSGATGSYYARNIKFSTTAETPTTEGDICFKLA